MMVRTFTAVYQRTPHWWVAYAKELPGANTQGKTLEEARENLREAILLMLEEYEEEAASEADNREIVVEELSVSFG